MIMNNKNRTFSLIGASKTGLSISYNLYKNDFIPEFLWNRTKQNLRKGIEVIPFLKYSNNLSSLKFDTEWIIISVSDDAIEKIVKRICEISPNLFGKKIFHISGTLNSDILIPLRNLGAKTGSFHPVCSIPDIEFGMTQIPRTIFTCEGDLQEDLMKIASLIGLEGIPINSQQKKAIHISAVFLNNYLNGLIASIKNMNSEVGILPENSRKILKQITLQTVEIGWDKSIIDSLTGPIKRGDLGTINDHLEFLKDKNKLKNLYKDFGRLLLDFADFNDTNIKIKLEEKFQK